MKRKIAAVIAAVGMLFATVGVASISASEASPAACGICWK